ncbi:phosphorylase family protein [Sorangium sp. So ce388]|uniref:VMAP-C domain-containing protein n=1 Tax=Sorangium sp. So ce388 TaxID=3133309 RepID=UPI003F5B46B2
MVSTVEEGTRAEALARLVTVGIVTALPEEFAAVKTMLDEPVSWLAPGRGAGCEYALGEIPSYDGGRHVVALALADMGNNSAAARGTLLLQHFPGAEAILMVGIAGGVPNPVRADEHVRLGDVVVSDHRGVVQYDNIKKTRKFAEVRASPRPPHARLWEAARFLEADALGGKRPWESHVQRAASLMGAARPDASKDVLRASSEPFKPVKHPADPKRIKGQPRIFAGPIASANVLLKDPVWRDRLREQHGAKAVEMEASGIADATWMHGVGYLAVRGICDYCDSYKNDDWHMYAAITAAAYARAVLGRMRKHPEAVREPDRSLEQKGAAAAIRSTISRELRERILETVGPADFSREHLLEAYKESAPVDWRHHFDGDRNPDLVRCMLVKLATALGQSDGAHPILRFALHLRKVATRPALVAALHDWFDDAAAHLGLDAPAQRALQDEVDRSGSAGTRVLHLVVVMEESLVERGCYAVRASRALVRPGETRWSVEDIEPLEVDQGRVYTLEETRALLNELLSQLDDDLCQSNDQLTVELVVPLGVLGCDADRWELKRGVHSTVPFGVEYDIVLRSWERAYDPRCKRITAAWAAKWGRVHESCGGAVAWACTHDDAAAGLATRLHAQGPAAVVLRFAPPRSAADVGSRVLGELIDAGIPVAVWPREPPEDEARFKTWVEQLTGTILPAGWPAAVKEHRREAHRGTDRRHPGHHLTLLWDDPNKLLPDARPWARLASPTRTRRTAR